MPLGAPSVLIVRIISHPESTIGRIKGNLGWVINSGCVYEYQDFKIQEMLWHKSERNSRAAPSQTRFPDVYQLVGCFPDCSHLLLRQIERVEFVDMVRVVVDQVPFYICSLIKYRTLQVGHQSSVLQIKDDQIHPGVLLDYILVLFRCELTCFVGPLGGRQGTHM